MYKYIISAKTWDYIGQGNKNTMIFLVMCRNYSEHMGGRMGNYMEDGSHVGMFQATSLRFIYTKLGIHGFCMLLSVAMHPSVKEKSVRMAIYRFEG